MERRCLKTRSQGIVAGRTDRLQLPEDARGLHLSLHPRVETWINQRVGARDRMRV